VDEIPGNQNIVFAYQTEFRSWIRRFHKMSERIQVLEHDGRCPGDHVRIFRKINGGNTWVGVIHGFCEVGHQPYRTKPVGHFDPTFGIVEINTIYLRFFDTGGVGGRWIHILVGWETMSIFFYILYNHNI